ncbi:ABC transporter ATP-binding protein [Parasediminibacterium sp. JCM 36343]|uniref:ABC transporter ATP-binding protein n=1 Tax=Parasediminibacterium sp. JCM 36343 TaxID=3374279 RepID=UPI00397D22F1
MSETVIKVENLSKQYRLGEIGTGSISHDLQRWLHRIRGKEDPYLKIGEENDRTSKGSSDYVWALRDINFEVKRGEVLGIIGRNGAGKSTLLKLLSKTSAPTIGNIKIKGRIASLLEVGTGFHPDLSGRDNIFLNGAILGMTKQEIKSKFDEIVDFSGVERYIDTPVKRYSSGMYVRLAFAVAAHLEPEILIVDEVLAVGDAEFQKKCLGKMKDVSVNDGRTVLFVSHNMSAVSSLCTSGLYLKNGKLFKHSNNLDNIIAEYLQSGYNDSTVNSWAGDNGDESLSLKEVNIWGEEDVAFFFTDKPLFVDIKLDTYKAISDLVIALEVESSRGHQLAISAQYDNANDDLPTELLPGSHHFRLTIPPNTLAQGDYKLIPNIGVHNVKRITSDNIGVKFSVENTNGLGLKFLTGSGQHNILRPNWKWQKLY